MNLKKAFCVFLSVIMLVSTFSAYSVSASAENGTPSGALGDGQPPEKPNGDPPGDPPDRMPGGMGAAPDGAPGGEMGTPPEGGKPGGGPGKSSADID